MRVEILSRIMEDGSDYVMLVNLDNVCLANSTIIPGTNGSWKNTTTLAMTNGMIVVVKKTFKEFQKIMSQERK